MNGVRRFLGGGAPNTPPPPPPAPAPTVSPPASTPPIPPPKSLRPPQDLPIADGKSTSGTPGLVIRKERTKTSQVASPTSDQTPGSASTQPSRPEWTPASVRSPTGSITSYSVSVASPTRRSIPYVGPSTPSSSHVPPLASPGLPTTPGSGWKQPSGSVNIRDELLMSLLTSEAVVDSRECEILCAEEVEELKKVRVRIHVASTASLTLLQGTPCSQDSIHGDAEKARSRDQAS